MRLFASVCVLSLFFVFVPDTTHATLVTPCKEGSTLASNDIVQQYPQFKGLCLTEKDIKDFASGAEILKKLASKPCPGYSVGFPAGADPDKLTTAEYAKVKETTIYFSAGKYSMNPKFISCVGKFLEKADAAKVNWCVSAGLRTPGHQKASAADPRNKVVCGRSGSVNGCPHVKGVALDFNVPGGNIEQLQRIAASISGLNMNIPRDPWHLQSSGTTCMDERTLPSTGQEKPTGQIVSQPTTPFPSTNKQYYCITSINPVVMVPSDTPPGPNCLNYPGRTQQQSPTTAQQGTQVQQGTSGTSGTSGQTKQPATDTQNTTPYPTGTCSAGYRCILGAVYFRSNTCVDSLYRQCQSGCADSLSCVAATSTATTSASNSAFNELLSFLGSVSTSSQTASTTIIISSGELRTLESGAITIAPAVPHRPITLQNIATSDDKLMATDTFASGTAGDIGYSGYSGRVGLSATLVEIRSALQNILSFLRPFRGSVPQPAE